MSKLKSFIYKVACNNVTGTIINKIYPKGIPDIRWKGFKFLINSKKVSKRIAASIFFGFYESSEIRFIHKYYKGDSDVVELGGSLGIVSSHIGSLMKSGRKHIVVEPNPFLISVARKNIERHSHGDFNLINAALHYSSEKARLAITTNNTASQLVTSLNDDGKIFEIDSLTLGSIVEKEKLTNYSLVCDIEGSEIDFLLNDKEALQNCNQILIELHDTQYNGTAYNVEKLKNLILQAGFTQIDNEGPVYFFRK
ncbi:MAG TPA: FkbM family methyltransferase [Chitinophagaceae bacterium]|nr:FkbM family methyltransferase [Chitinophagaceae bacterium]